MFQCEVKCLHDLVFVYEGHYDLLVLLEPLEHVEAELEGRFIACLLAGAAF